MYVEEEKHNAEIKDAKATEQRKEMDQGEYTKAIATVKKLLQMGLGTPKEIMEVTGLSIEEINKLKEEM